MRAGAMRDRVAIQKRAAPASKYVKNAPAWTYVVTGRAATIKPMGGNETVIANRLQGEENYSIMLRTESALDEISAAWRVVELDETISPAQIVKVYDIRHVARPGRLRDMIVLTCVAGRTDEGG